MEKKNWEKLEKLLPLLTKLEHAVTLERWTVPTPFNTDAPLPPTSFSSVLLLARPPGERSRFAFSLLKARPCLSRAPLPPPSPSLCSPHDPRCLYRAKSRLHPPSSSSSFFRLPPPVNAHFRTGSSSRGLVSQFFLCLSLPLSRSREIT